MLLVLYAALIGAASALAFEPAGWWPLIFVAFAAICELLTRTKRLWGAIGIGWAFGFGQFVVGLNWIATAFTFQAKMPPSLGWVAVVLLSIYLAVYPAIATGLAWRLWREDKVSLLRSCRAPGRSPNGCAGHCSPASRGTRSPRPWSRPR